MKKNYSFEEGIAELEKLVNKLERGDVTLDEALADFESAASLVKHLNAVLEKAEQRIKMISENADGGYKEEPFGDAEEKS